MGYQMHAVTHFKKRKNKSKTSYDQELVYTNREKIIIKTIKKTVENSQQNRN